MTVTVQRSGVTSGALTVNYATADGTAKAGTDYKSASGALSWTAGDATAKTVTVALISEAAFGSYRSFTVALIGASGGTTVAPNSATITISGTGSTQAMGVPAAARLLMQGTMGASLTDLATTSSGSYDAWFAAQAAAPISLQQPQIASYYASQIPSWWYNVMNGSDQLRQRMTFALSEIFVVSSVNPILYDQGEGLGLYHDQLAANALGNFRALLDAVSTSPEMGAYLTFFKNDKPNAATGVHADENYAREIMQLFTIGLWQLNADGSTQLDNGGNSIPTYAQADVTNLARVFTGWGSAPVGNATASFAWDYDLDYLHPMVCYSAHHDTDAKTIVGGVQIPAGGTCASDMKIALDTLFNHQNTAPFISKQLIQRLVTSNPSPAYVARVAAVFANDGTGVRGNLLAVAKAILTDPEATTIGTAPGAGKLREPILRLTSMWRAFSASAANGQVDDLITSNAIADFGEDSLESPTVFNFFTPSYQRAGPLATAGLVAPEFQITNENTIVLTANDLETQAYKFVDSNGNAEVGVDNVGGGGKPGPTDMVLHTAAWEPYAADAGTLVDQLALVFMPGQMPATMRTTLVNYVNIIPATSPANRVIEAFSLMMNSPQYSVQR